MTTDDKATCTRSLELMATGSLEEMAEVYAPDAVNRESAAEPAATRGTGPEALRHGAVAAGGPLRPAVGGARRRRRRATSSSCTRR